MYKKLSRALMSISVMAVLAGSNIAMVSAATTGGSPGSGLRISPVRTDLTINPGESGTVDVMVNNVTSATNTYQAIINDFVAADNEYGQPALILDADKFAPSHSLKRYVLPTSNVTVPAGGVKTVKIVINIPKDAAAGGYYGAVRFTPVSDVKGQNLTLAASVGSLILVKVPGDVKEDMSLLSFDVRGSEQSNNGSSFFTSNKSLYAMARFKNSGNVHEQPFGKVVVKKDGKIVQAIEINSAEPKGNVLPDSIRRFSVKLDKVGAFGHYTVDGNFGYGSNGQLLSGKTSFWVIPLGLIFGIILAIVLIVAAIIGLPRAIKRYNENIIRKSRRR